MATIEKLCAPGVVGSLSHPDYMIELEAIAVI